MRLQMPFEKSRIPGTPIGDDSEVHRHIRLPMYSILVICAQKHSREATTKHIEMTLPKDVPHQITAVETVADAEKLIGGHESVTFTHVVLNLGSAEEVIGVVDRIIESSGGSTSVLVLSDSVQRQAVLKLASDPTHQQLLDEKRMTFVYKPVKPSRFAVIFDPANERDLSVDLNRSSAAQMVESQKQNYIDVEKRIGNKGYRVMLVEDNPVNQKVLVRYLKKVGIDAEIAADGVECTDKVFSRGPGYYSLILVCLDYFFAVAAIAALESAILTPLYSVIYTCLARTDTKHAAKFELGRRKEATRSYQSSRSLPTSCQTFKRNVMLRDSATTSRSRLTLST